MFKNKVIYVLCDTFVCDLKYFKIGIKFVSSFLLNKQESYDQAVCITFLS